jgi:hypothetical protein
MARKEVDRQRVIARFESIRAAFPHLTMTLDADPGNVDVSLEIPKQPGLDFDVFVNLQEDELHLTAGTYFWVEWFPCTDEGVEADFFESVDGLLCGRFRIVEHYRRGKAFKAVLQRPINRGWESRKTWHSPRLPLGSLTRVVLQNRQNGERTQT